MSLWPFRTGNNERFQSTAQEETIYDALGKEMPLHRYEVEMANYLEWRWRRGFLQTVFPATCYGAVCGFLVGFRQSKTEGRYIGRYRILWRYTSTFAAVGLLTTAFHHMLVVRNNYHDRFFYPILAGSMGAVVLTTAAQMGTIGQGVFVGSLIGVLYSLGCYATTYYQKRRLGVFLRQQQQMLIPVHKVSPELQPMYRAFLFDHRPIEDEDIAKREAVFLARGEEDTRLDATTFLMNMFPETYDWVNFPDWWPLKHPLQTEEQQMLLERQREEEIERRKTLFIDTDDGAFLKRYSRAKAYRGE